jgi:hypothetical protein
VFLNHCDYLLEVRVCRKFILEPTIITEMLSVADLRTKLREHRKNVFKPVSRMGKAEVAAELAVHGVEVSEPAPPLAKPNKTAHSGVTASAKVAKAAKGQAPLKPAQVGSGETLPPPEKKAVVDVERAARMANLRQLKAAKAAAKGQAPS